MTRATTLDRRAGDLPPHKRPRSLDKENLYSHTTMGSSTSKQSTPKRRALSHERPTSSTPNTAKTRSFSSSSSPGDDTVIPSHDINTKLMDGAPDNELHQVQVQEREELEKLEALDDAITKLEALLASKTRASLHQETTDISWHEEFEGITIMRQLAVHHQDKAADYIDEALPLLVVPGVENLRSAMSRNALLCLEDFLLCLPTAISNHNDVIIPLLVQRCASEKQFIRELAKKALTTAVTTTPTMDLLNILLSTGEMEKHATAINAASSCILKCLRKVSKSDVQALFDIPVEDLTSESTTRTSDAIPVQLFLERMASMLQGRAVEGKQAIRNGLKYTKTVVGADVFDAYVKKYLAGTAQVDVLQATKAQLRRAGHSASLRERMKERMKEHQDSLEQKKAAGDDEIIVMAPKRK